MFDINMFCNVGMSFINTLWVCTKHWSTWIWDIIWLEIPYRSKMSSDTVVVQTCNSPRPYCATPNCFHLILILLWIFQNISKIIEAFFTHGRILIHYFLPQRAFRSLLSKPSLKSWFNTPCSMAFSDCHLISAACCDCRHSLAKTFVPHLKIITLSELTNCKFNLKFLSRFQISQITWRYQRQG